MSIGETTGYAYDAVSELANEVKGLTYPDKSDPFFQRIDNRVWAVTIAFENFLNEVDNAMAERNQTADLSVDSAKIKRENDLGK